MVQQFIFVNSRHPLPLETISLLVFKDAIFQKCMFLWQFSCVILENYSIAVIICAYTYHLQPLLITVSYKNKVS